jgi:hypothetical protein
MGLRSPYVSVLTLALAALSYTSAEPSGGGGRSNSGYNSVANPRNNQCNFVRCQNGGYCDTLSSGRAQCVCPPGFSGPNCENRGRDGNSCSSLRCENGGNCDTDGVGRPHCHCTTGFSGVRCETRDSPRQPPQSITNLRCDSACSTATSCRICLPCDTCQYQTMCLAYEILVKSLDAECHAQGYQEALLMKSTNNLLGFSQIKCRGQGPIRDCPQGSSCVDDGRGGGTCCRNRVGRDQLENKQGYCPARTDTQSCGRLSCQGDIDCAGNLKCCQACGNRCTNPNSNPGNDFPRDPCQGVVCQNGGRCVFPADAPYCECPRGFRGSKCEIRDDRSGLPCDNFVCQNGGRCDATGGTAHCECSNGYTGIRCETRQESCQTVRCLNGGRCVLLGGRPSCECTRDYRGPRCGIRDEPCKGFRCENGGRCVTRGDEPICQCAQGFRGPRCGLRDDPCQDVRCLNGGRCSVQGTSPVCQCPRGFTGPQCGVRDTPQDPCLNFRCQNGGRCRASSGTAYCECPSGYSGPGCEDRTLTPTRSPCQAVGGCNGNTNDQCGGCPRGWTCQSIRSPCPTFNCPSTPSYRCVSPYRKK